MPSDAIKKEGSDEGLIFSRMDCLPDVIRRIGEHPSINNVKADIRNYLPYTFIALYSSDPERGFGSCMLDLAEYKSLKDRFSDQLEFIEI